MPADLKAMYEGILASCGGADNIVTLGCCMTRLRFTVKDEALVSPDALRKVRDVAGYFYSGSQHQLIVGPSTAGKLAAYFHEHHHFLLQKINFFHICHKNILPSRSVFQAELQ